MLEWKDIATAIVTSHVTIGAGDIAASGRENPKRCREGNDPDRALVQHTWRRHLSLGKMCLAEVCASSVDCDTGQRFQITKFRSRWRQCSYLADCEESKRLSQADSVRVSCIRS